MTVLHHPVTVLRHGGTVAIMQPYFVPYAGYFRLLSQTDLFIVYDCVQFPRRGWVHRNRLTTVTDELDWLTLPLEKAPQDVLIRDLRFRADAGPAFAAQLRRFPAFARPHPFAEAMADLAGSPVDHIERLLRLAGEAMGLPWRSLRSSSLAIPAQIRGQERILAIAEAVGARRYLNPPGGRALYDAPRFTARGMELAFLPDHAGSFVSIAERLLTEDARQVAQELRPGG